MKKCICCNTMLPDNASFCNNCGTRQPAGFTMNNQQYCNNNYNQGYNCNQGYRSPNNSFDLNDYYMRNNAFDDCPEGKSRGIFALFALFLGCFGIQYFYIGKVTAGILTILLSLVTCGVWEILMFIQGIVVLCNSNYSFRTRFVISNSTLPIF